MKDFIQKSVVWMKKEAVLTAAFVLVVGSACLQPPDSAYINYIDWDTLILLFCLMAVIRTNMR